MDLANKVEFNLAAANIRWRGESCRERDDDAEKTFVAIHFIERNMVKTVVKR